MKNAYKLLGIVVLALAIVFSFMACDSGTGGGDPTSITYISTNGTNTYKLTVSKAAKAAYTPAEGDSYVLIIYSGSSASGAELGRSTGTIKGSGSEFTLDGEGTANNKVTVSNGRMTAIEGSITINGTPYTPGTSLSPVTSGGGVKVTVEATSGQLTITGIDATYNGKYAYATNFDWFFGATNISPDVKFTLGKIENGSVTLNVWKKIESGNSVRFANYNGSDSGQQIFVKIFNKGIITYADESQSLKTASFTSVAFTSGIGTINASSTTWQ
jgi:hypothetical protein